MTSRVSAGLRLSNVAPETESHHSPAVNSRKVGVLGWPVSAGDVAGVGVLVSVMGRSVIRGVVRSVSRGEPGADRGHVLVVEVAEQVRLLFLERPMFEP